MTALRVPVLLLATLVASTALIGCKLPSLISALDGDYYHISGGTNVYVTIKRNATEEMYFAMFSCMLGGRTQLDCARGVLALSAVTVEANMDEGGPAKWFWDNKIKNAFEADEAEDFIDALTNLSVRSHECLRISIRSGENWTTADDSLAECSWGKDPFPGNGV